MTFLLLCKRDRHDDEREQKICELFSEAQPTRTSFRMSVMHSSSSTQVAPIFTHFHLLCSAGVTVLSKEQSRIESEDDLRQRQMTSSLKSSRIKGVNEFQVKYGRRSRTWKENETAWMQASNFPDFHLGTIWTSMLFFLVLFSHVWRVFGNIYRGQIFSWWLWW